MGEREGQDRGPGKRILRKKITYKERIKIYNHIIFKKTILYNSYLYCRKAVTFSPLANSGTFYRTGTEDDMSPFCPRTRNIPWNERYM